MRITTELLDAAAHSLEDSESPLLDVDGAELASAVNNAHVVRAMLADAMRSIKESIATNKLPTFDPAVAQFMAGFYYGLGVGVRMGEITFEGKGPKQ